MPQAYDLLSNRLGSPCAVGLPWRQQLRCHLYQVRYHLLPGTRVSQGMSTGIYFSQLFEALEY